MRQQAYVGWLAPPQRDGLSTAKTVTGGTRLQEIPGALPPALFLVLALALSCNVYVIPTSDASPRIADLLGGATTVPLMLFYRWRKSPRIELVLAIAVFTVAVTVWL